MRRLGAIKASHKFPFAYQNSFPTPVCRKFHTIQGQIKGSIDATPEMSYTKRVPRDLNDELQTFRNGSPEGRYRIYTGIFSWLCELLLSTEVKENEAHKKSLLGMCLRKIPACVDDIERWDRETSQDKVTSSLNGTISVSLEIYGQLEEFGAAGLGWRPLKQTVRAHGMSLLKKAVAEGLFDASFVGLLKSGGCVWLRVRISQRKTPSRYLDMFEGLFCSPDFGRREHQSGKNVWPRRCGAFENDDGNACQ
ncbi:hypothetical protein GMORB2_6858 [Geosmithia morbida]|uniref:Uncharacterized protein n=1 Tax=Geosmithia morbida TaxID=1094350 RepID=A0A9P4YUF9_9HYPO|nr:uncharacterized protein GMORB2_6858 [Geosmithia morbida]KAF4123306.1 hypothetical protein GMORB2_6858 [Geosmithia morbida]